MRATLFSSARKANLPSQKKTCATLIMKFSNIVQLLLPMATAAADRSLRGQPQAVDRDLQATFPTCFLRELTSGREVQLTGSDSYTVGLAETFSMRCEVTGTQEINFIKFFYNGIVHDEFPEPRWLDGDTDAGDYVVPVPYLAACGGKNITVQGHAWAAMQFEKVYTLTAVCPPPPTFAPTAAPRLVAPTAAPLLVAPNAAPRLVAPTAAPLLVAPNAAPRLVAPTAAPRLVAPTAPVAVTKAPLAPTPFSGITKLELVYTGVVPHASVQTVNIGAVNIVDLRALGLPLGARFSINAVQNDATVNSVLFSNGQKETSLPWAYCGNVGPTFNNCPDLVVGKTVNVTMIPYPERNQVGPAFPLLWATVQIVNGPSRAPTTRAPTAAPVVPPRAAPAAPIAPPPTAPQNCSIPKVSVQYHQPALTPNAHNGLIVLFSFANC
jgi:hypothetical protein